MYTPPGIPRSRSFTRFTIRVAFEHFGQSVLLFVSMTFLRSPVFATFDILLSPVSQISPAHGLGDHRTGFVGPSWTGSSAPFHLGSKAWQNRGTEQNAPIESTAKAAVQSPVAHSTAPARPSARASAPETEPVRRR